MARNRTPQTQEKRRREHEKQLRQQEKIAKRNERSVAKKEAKESGQAPPPAPVLDPKVEFFLPLPNPKE